MPRNVRNFWIELQVDGRYTPIATGPVSKDGGFRVKVRIRENGTISDNYVELIGVASPNGNLNILGGGNLNGVITTTHR